MSLSILHYLFSSLTVSTKYLIRIALNLSSQLKCFLSWHITAFLISSLSSRIQVQIKLWGRIWPSQVKDNHLISLSQFSLLLIQINTEISLIIKMVLKRTFFLLPRLCIGRNILEDMRASCIHLSISKGSRGELLLRRLGWWIK